MGRVLVRMGSRVRAVRLGIAARSMGGVELRLDTVGRVVIGHLGRARKDKQ
jgi:hypothetical protein